jgi:hypothetical protein
MEVDRSAETVGVHRLEDRQSGSCRRMRMESGLKIGGVSMGRFTFLVEPRRLLWRRG